MQPGAPSTERTGEAGAVGLLVLDEAGALSEASPGAERAVGWPREALLGQRLDLLGEPYATDCARLLRKLSGAAGAAEGPAGLLGSELICADGRRRFAILLPGAGTPAAAGAAVVPYVDDVLPDGRHRNRYAGACLHLLLDRQVQPGGDVIGAWRSAVHVRDRLAEGRHLTTVARGEPSVARYRVIGADGAARWVCDRACPRPLADGRVVVYGVVTEAAAVPPGSELSRRQREVLALLADGVSTKAAAARLGVSTTTVRNHVAAALRELGCHSRLEAIARAREHGLL